MEMKSFFSFRGSYFAGRGTFVCVQNLQFFVLTVNSMSI